MRSSVRSRLAPPGGAISGGAISGGAIAQGLNRPRPHSSRRPLEIRVSPGSSLKREGLGRELSDIVKRKRIRSKDRGGFKDSIARSDLLVRRGLESISVVGFWLDRFSSRMRLKQNWSFQKSNAIPSLAQGGGTVDCRVELGRIFVVGRRILIDRAIDERGFGRTARVGNESNQVS
jgi:hypothetical protein